ncbi:MAG: prolyl oligopeptidase family serine peptidase [Clostridia bacterium]|nr:prolyl oligopeptidase family serine peptidase [Clostridia bacterium]
MKRIICFLLIIMLASASVSCGGKTAEDPAAGDTSAEEETTTAEKKEKIDNHTAVINAFSGNPNVKRIEALEPYPIIGDDIEWYSIICTVNGLDLHIIMFLPDDFQTEEYPAMVYIPRNITGEQDRYSGVAEKGVVVFAVFARGYAEYSEGYMDFGGDRDLDDISAAVDLAYSCDFVDSDRILLVGSSELSICVLRYISEDYGNRKPVRAAAAIDPMHDLYTIYEGVDETWKERFRTYYTFGTPEERPEEFDKRSPGRLAGNIEVPIYIAYFNVPDENGTDGLVRFGIDGISYYENYVDKLKSLDRNVTSVHYDTVALDLDTEQFKMMAEWFLTLDENDPVDFASVKAGDVIRFGRYEQNGIAGNGYEDIEWTVLDVTGNKALLLSRYVLDVIPYNDKRTNVTWETCTLREWLNGEFYNAAFDKDEKEMIVDTPLENYDNPEFGTDGGNDTTDKVFLPDLYDITDPDYGFSPGNNAHQSRECRATQYAIDRGAAVYCEAESKLFNGGTVYDGNCGWLTRSSGYDPTYAVSVYVDGTVCIGGDYVDHLNAAVRPAVWINIGS